MYEKQVRLSKWGYVFNNNENESENENRSHRYNINRPRPRQGPKYTKYEMCLSIMMAKCTKQRLSNIWSSIHEKGNQHWGWLQKKSVTYKKACNYLSVYFRLSVQCSHNKFASHEQVCLIRLRFNELCLMKLRMHLDFIVSQKYTDQEFYKSHCLILLLPLYNRNKYIATFWKLMLKI